MKKVILILLCFTIFAGAISCDKSDNTSLENLYNDSSTYEMQSIQKASNNGSGQQKNDNSIYNSTAVSSVDYSNLNNLPQSYLQVIKNEKPFIFMGEKVLFDNYRFPYHQQYLTQRNNVQYAVLDMDGDEKQEVLIRGWTNDILVLHEENGSIYGFDFTFRGMYNVKTDGAYFWNINQGNTYGCSKLLFKNEICSIIELSRVELSEDGNHDFFVASVKVSKDEYDSFIESRSEAKNVTWHKLSIFPKHIGYLVKTESSYNLKYFMKKDKDTIKVEHENYGSNTFYITTFWGDSKYQTTIMLSEGIRTPDIYAGFTSDQHGYVMIFHMEGYSVSPMDDIELACILKTVDGGKTWNISEYNDFKVSDGREYISAACFYTDDVGFFTARYTNTDHFGPRTYWTVDGGKTWMKMPRIDIPNVLELFGIKGADFSTEISDVTVTDDAYTITVRICHGYSLEIDGEQNVDIYIQYQSEDLVNWVLM